MQKTVVFSNALSAMLMGKSGGSMLRATGNTMSGFTHGQQVGWHGSGFAIFSVITTDGRLISVGMDSPGGQLRVNDKSFIDACEWGKGKSMSQYFSNPNGTENLSGLSLKTQFAYPTQWYPGTTYPGTENAAPGGASGGGGGNVGSGFVPGPSPSPSPSPAPLIPGTTNHNMMYVLLAAAVGAAVWYFAKQR